MERSPSRNLTLTVVGTLIRTLYVDPYGGKAVTAEALGSATVDPPSPQDTSALFQIIAIAI